ncbi:MaoC family dehydratase N-terminal domain-containing protein [Natrialbaceae archaeon GCM10025810]|uniref:FAS1-like dehydratase domain-containing protein n=1 Tax=Halovalidus salilacus TaxID=3075124 RepID=UPI00360B8125
MPSKPLSELEAMVGEQRVTVEEFRIEAGKVEEFARAITEPNPIFRDEDVAREAGYEAIPAPLTYTRVGRFPRYRPDDVEGYGFDLGFEPEYVLHGEQSYEYERPLLVGDVLTGTTTLADVYQRDSRRAGTMTFAVHETAYRDENDELVLTERATAIETEGAVDDGDGDDAGGEDGSGASANGGTDVIDVDPSDSSADPESRVAAVSEVEVGDPGPTAVVEDLERRHFATYAGASGDFNPIHYDEPYARAAGNERVFGQGMFTAGVASRVVTDWFGLERIDSFGVRFQSRVFPGDTIVATGEVADVDRDDGTVAVDIAVETPEGTTLLTGRSSATLSSGN